MTDPSAAPSPDRKKLEDKISSLRQELQSLDLGTPSRPAAPPPQLTQLGQLCSIAGLEERVIQLSAHGRIEYINSGLLKMTGKTRGAVLGQPLDAIDHFPWGSGLLTRLVRQALASGQEERMEQVCAAPLTGKDIFWEIRAIPRENKIQILIKDISKFRTLEQTFRRYVSPKVIERLNSLSYDPSHIDRHELTVIFCDLRDFTPLIERLDPRTVREVINDYLGLMTDVIERFDATLDKVVGDEVMVLCGAPLPEPGHAGKALLVAEGMRAAQRRLQERWSRRISHPLHSGIGVNTGEMIVGNIGTTKRSDYTVLGLSVNIASRLCSKAAGGQILIGPRTWECACQETPGIAARFSVAKLGPVPIKGVSDLLEVLSLNPARTAPEA